MHVKYLLPALLPLASAYLTEICSKNGWVAQDGYNLTTDLWGEEHGVGSQCVYLDSISASGISWHTEWSWAEDPTFPKSYAHSAYTIEPKLVSEIKKLPTTADWCYEPTDINADVAYDLFTAADPNHVQTSGDWELMVWLARYGHIQALGSNIKNVTVAGETWELWYGTSQTATGTQKTYSFLALSPIKSWCGDINVFFKFLTENYDYPASTQYLLTYQFGSEAFDGANATLTVSKWTGGLE